MWQREDDPAERSWSEATARCGSLVLGGRDDWRLPEFMELLSISNPGGPLVDPAAFPRTGAGCFWSATLAPPEREGSVWVVDWLVRGVGDIGSSSASCRTRCLASIIDTGHYWPTMDLRSFTLPAGASDAFWSSTQAKPNAGWVVRYFDGALWDGYDDQWRGSVRCVRSVN